MIAKTHYRSARIDRKNDGIKTGGGDNRHNNIAHSAWRRALCISIAARASCCFCARAAQSITRAIIEWAYRWRAGRRRRASEAAARRQKIRFTKA